jgi:CheY-like chemotaxis protein
MPRKNGKEAYEAIKKIRPDIRAFYITGYAGDIIYESGIIKGEVDLLSKPLLSTELLRKVREVLDR